MVEGLIALHLAKYETSGAEVCMGHATFSAPSTLPVRLIMRGTRTIVGDCIFLNIGSRSTIPDIPGLHQASLLTHIEILELNVIPEHLIVIGGGFVGLEFA